MDSCAYQDAIYHPYADMKKSSDALFAVFNRATEKSTLCAAFLNEVIQQCKDVLDDDVAVGEMFVPREDEVVAEVPRQ